jgi:hypothetical protein
LYPHTDRNARAIPSTLVLLSCESEAAIGGDALLVDGRSLYQTLSRECPHVLLHMEDPKAMVFRNADGCLCAPIFNRHSIQSASSLASSSTPPASSPMCRLTVRFRNDTNGFPSCMWAPHWQQVLDIIDRLTVTMTFKVGEGYIVDNTWSVFSCLNSHS